MNQLIQKIRLWFCIYFHKKHTYQAYWHKDRYDEKKDYMVVRCVKCQCGYKIR